jgi:hypothetical protein
MNAHWPRGRIARNAKEAQARLVTLNRGQRAPATTDLGAEAVRRRSAILFRRRDHWAAAKTAGLIDAKTIADGAARLIVANRAAENGKAITRLAEIVVWLT